MPLTVPAGLLTKANFITAYLKPLVDANETNASSALATANAANTLAGQKYTKPAGGIPDSDQVLTNRVGYQTWNGTAWSARPSGYKFVEAFSDGTAGSTRDTAAPAPTGAVNGDRWWKAA